MNNNGFAGKDKWHIHDNQGTEITVSDGPHGLRIEEGSYLGFDAARPSVAFPTSSAAANTFDPALVYEAASCMAEECAAEGVDILLGPGVNHKRSPLCGRNFEYYSEDPLLSGTLGSAYVRGLQDHGIGSSLKHFAANSRESYRNSEDSVVDERALHEIYLRQFEQVVREAKPWTIMMAYNRLNGTYCCENGGLMKEASSWGFDGLFISDWGGVSDPVASFIHGLDVQMPGPDGGVSERLAEAMRQGIITDEDLRVHAERVRSLTEKCRKQKSGGYDLQKHLNAAQTMAEEAMVLAKNDGVLPLAPDSRIAVIGRRARSPYTQGRGSSRVTSLVERDLLTVLEEKKRNFVYCDGSSRAEALKAAAAADAVVFVTGLKEEEEEGFDRPDMELPAEENSLMEEIAGVTSNLIAVVESGSPVRLPWSERVKAVLLKYLSGCMSADALERILYGEVNPSGKLAETWPLCIEDTPSYGNFNETDYRSLYKESVFTGYRYYSSMNIPVRYPFGHGLSYTSFAYSGAEVKREEEGVRVSVSVANTGACRGRETVQFYHSMKDSRIIRPLRELAGFASVTLEPGETKKAEVLIPYRNFMYYDVREKDYRLEQGTYEILVGRSSQQIEEKAEVFLEGTEEPYAVMDGEYLPDSGKFADVSDEQFAGLLGRSLARADHRKPFSPDSTISDLQYTAAGRLILKGINFAMKHSAIVKGVRPQTVYETPLRMMRMMNDRVTWKTVDGTVDVLNGQVVKGTKEIIAGIGKK